jgi:hypothetical protein
LAAQSSCCALLSVKQRIFANAQKRGKMLSAGAGQFSASSTERRPDGSCKPSPGVLADKVQRQDRLISAAARPLSARTPSQGTPQFEIGIQPDAGFQLARLTS